MTRRLILALLAAVGLLGGVAHAQTQPPNAAPPSAQTAPTSPPAPAVVPDVHTEGSGVPLSETAPGGPSEQVPELTPVPPTPEPFFDQPPNSPPVQVPLS